jgi:hypothetical protein
MTPEDGDLALHYLGRLAVLTPEAARSARVRARCRAVLAQQQTPGEGGKSAARTTAVVVQSALPFALSAGFLAAMILDALRVYARR